MMELGSQSSLPPLALSVYRSPKDGKRVLAHAVYPGVIHGERAVWPLVIPFGTPVQHAYAQAMAFAQHHGIAVEVNDPHGLFPAPLRPTQPTT
jgi:hypothetical protein